MARPLFPMAVAVVIAIGAACGASTTPPLVLGPFQDHDPTLLDEAVAVVRSLGYDVLGVDSTMGRFTIVARWTGRKGQQTFVDVQLYREGWIRMQPRGFLVRMRDDRYRLPTALYREMITLSTQLQAELRENDEEPG